MNIWQNKDWGPMLLKEIDEPFDSKDYIFEMKFDGIRGIIFASPKGIVIKSRNNQDLTHLFPELQSIKHLVQKKTIFDGEIVVFDNKCPSFKKIQERIHLKNKIKIEEESISNPAVFVCFDILYHAEDLTNLNLLKRKKVLDKFWENDVFIKNKFIETEGIKLFNKIKKLGLEGIVAKKKNSLYEIDTRTDNWIKIKNLKEETFLVGGYTENKNATVSLVLGELRKDKLYYVGKVTLSKKNNFVKKVLNLKTMSISPFVDYNEKGVYVTPKLKCKVEFLERTKSKHLRHPTFRAEDLS